MKTEKAFTLTELMVVLLIIGILMAVSIPVFTNARDRAVARATQSRLSDAAKAAKLIYSDTGQDYTAITEAELDAEAQPIDFTISIGGTPAAGSSIVVVTARTEGVNNDTITMQTRDANDVIRQVLVGANGAATHSP